MGVARCCTCVLFFLFVGNLALAQSGTVVDTSAASLPRDTAIARPTKSTVTAMILSAVVPGAGQVYNESYWKVPVIAGFGVYFGYEFFSNHSEYKRYRDDFQASLATIPGGDSRLLRLREFYKEQRDSFVWYFLILYVINIADAYVDASLYEFDVGDDLSLRLVPETGVGAVSGPRLGFQLRF